MHYKDETYDFEWSDSLDAVVAAPEHHKVIFENENIRVLDTRVRPGETVPVHTHRWASVVYTLQTGEFVRFDAMNNTTLDTRVTPHDIEIDKASRFPPQQPHSIENVGMSEMRAITVELKNSDMTINKDNLSHKSNN